MSLATFADELLVICAALLLLSTYLIFWALRSRKLGRARCLARLVDGLLLIALTDVTTGLVLVGLVMVNALF